MLTWRPERGWFSVGVRAAVTVAGAVVLASGLLFDAHPSAPPAVSDETTNVQEGPQRRRELCRLARRAQAAVEDPSSAGPSRSG